MSERKETDACFCGFITAEMCGDPFWIFTTMIQDCRRAIGSSLVVWVGYGLDQFRWIKASPRTSVIITTKVFRTSYISRLGFLAIRREFAQKNAYWQEKISWIEFADRLPRVNGYSRERDPELDTPIQRTSSKMIEPEPDNPSS